MRTLLAFVFSILALVGLSSGAAHAQCVTCSGGHCVYVTSGHGSCVTYPDPDFPCKLACPNCPTAPCDPGGGGGGGGGGGCALFDPASARGSVAPNKTVATAGLLFRTSAATNAKVFGGRGRGYLVLPGGFGDLTVDGAARAIEGVAPEMAGRLTPAFGFSNFNNAGIPVSFTGPDGEGFGLAPATNDFGSHLQLRVRGMTRLTRAVGDVDLSGGDLLLIDVSMHGKAYILILKSDVLDSSSPDAESRMRSIQDSLRNGYPLFPNEGHEPFETC